MHTSAYIPIFVRDFRSIFAQKKHKIVMMIKMRPAVYANHRRKDGSYPVKIVVYFKGKERKLATHIVAEAKDLTRSLHLKQGEVLTLANEEIRQMREACADIPYFDAIHQDVDWVVNYIKAKLAKKHFRLDFFQFAETFIEGKKEGTAANYRQALNAFARFLGKEQIDINMITYSMVTEFVEFMNSKTALQWDRKTGEMRYSNKKKIPGLQAFRHVSTLGAIFKAAKRKYNDEDSGVMSIPRSPFTGHDIDVPFPKGQRPLPQEVIQRLISASTDNIAIRRSIDVAVVSFGLMGANLADLVEARPPKDGVWVYNRCKTRDRRADNAEMRVRVPECIAPYIDRLTDGRRSAWLGRLQEIKRLTASVNRGLKMWCEQEDIEPFTFYAVRKSWATIARKAGVDKSIVDEGLAHVGDFKMTDIYAERPWDYINDENAKVLALFKWD